MRLARPVFTSLALITCTVGNGRSQSLTELVNQVGDGVVVILTSERTVVDEAPGQLVSAGGLGSGFLISHDGDVMTAAHVVQTADRVLVLFPSGERIPATVEGSDPSADVALLRLDYRPTGVVPLELGDSDAARVGDQVFVMGAPLGATHTLTVGYISARRKSNSTFGLLSRAELLQTDAAINQGNSGGPMFNMQGQVIGVVSHILSQSGGFEGLGFAVTSNVARDLLLSGPTVWTGVDAYWLNGELARVFNVPQESGILVQRVAIGSLADRMGLRGGVTPITIGEERVIAGGDIVLGVNGMELTEDQDVLDQMWDALRSMRPGVPLTISVLRGGQVIELSEGG